MMNLLPKEAKKVLDLERIRRLILVFGLLLGVVLFIGDVLLLPTWITLDLQERELGRQLSILEKSPELTKVEEIEEDIKTLNEKIKLYRKNVLQEKNPSLVFDAVLKYASPLIKIEEMAFIAEKNHFSLKGSADKREDFLAFVNILEGDPLVLRVESPISNILKENDINFSIIFEANEQLIRFPLKF